MGKNLNHTLTVLWIRFILKKDPDWWVRLRNNGSEFGSESVQKQFFFTKILIISLNNDFLFLYMSLLLFMQVKPKKVIPQQTNKLDFYVNFPMNLHDFLLPGSVSLNGSGSGRPK